MTTKTYDGQTARFLASVATCMPSLSSDIMQGWIDNPQGLKKFLSGLNPPESETTFRFTVDHGQALDQMIAAGQYDWTNDSITSDRFPVTGKGVIEYEARYFHFNRDISSKDVINEIEAEGWQVAKIEHVLAHGAKYPDEQRKFPIIGLGSVAEVDDRRSVPYLDKDGSERNLYLRWFGGGWNAYYRFLAVRKVSVA